MANTDSGMVGSRTGRPADPFPRTLWTEVVEIAGDPRADPALREASWTRLVAMYRRGIELCLRARLPSHGGGVDPVDDFVGYLFLHGVVGKADREVGKFRTWIQGVIRNYCRSVQRRARAAAPSIDEGVEMATSDDRAIVEDDRAWVRGLLRDALLVLDKGKPQQARALRLRYAIDDGGNVRDDELSAAEVAARIDSTPHAVEELLRRARRSLRETLLRRVADSLTATAAFEESFRHERDLVLRHAGALWPRVFGAGER